MAALPPLQFDDVQTQVSSELPPLDFGDQGGLPPLDFGVPKNEGVLDKAAGFINEMPEDVQAIPGLAETGVSMGTGFLGTIVGGAESLGTLANQYVAQGKSFDEAMQLAEETLRNRQDAMTYQPRIDKGKEISEGVGDLFGAVLEKGGEAGASLAGEDNAIAGKHIGQAVTEAGLMALPFAPRLVKGTNLYKDFKEGKIVAAEAEAMALKIEQAKATTKAAEAKAAANMRAIMDGHKPDFSDLKPNKAADGPNSSPTMAEGVLPVTVGGVKVETTIDRYKNAKQMDPKNPALSKVFGGVIDSPYLRIKQQFPNSTLPLELRRVDAEVGFKKTEYDSLVNRFNKFEKALTKDERKQYQQNWLRQEIDEVKKLTEAKLGTAEAQQMWKEYETAMNLRFEELKQTGLQIEAIPNYLPRFVTNMDKFSKSVPGTHQQKFYRLQEQYKKGELTSTEYSNKLNRLLTGGADPFVSPASTRHAKARTAEKAQHYDAYAMPADTLRTYFNETGTTIAERRFLGKGETTDRAIASKVDKEVEAGNITLEQAEQLRKVLSARFGPNVHYAPHSAVGVLKDVGYLSTIGQVGSAVLQFADVVAAFAMYPSTAIPAAIKSAMPKSIRNKMKMLETDQVGLGDIMQELSGKPSLSMKALDTTLRATGFKMVDRFGKRTIINAAHKRFQNLAKTKAGQQKLADMGYKNMYDKIGKGEWNKFVKDLASGDLKNDNVRFAVVNAVAEVQPIFLSDMPMVYLMHPNGRIAYSLKTWAIRFMNRLREDIMEGGRHAKSGNYKKAITEGYGKALTYATAMYLATNSIDFGKIGLHAWWHGDQLRPEYLTNKALDNFLTMFFFSNRYDWSLGYGKEPSDILISKVTPPALDLGNAIFKDLKLWDDWELEDSKVISKTPLIGRVVKDAAKPIRDEGYFWE